MKRAFAFLKKELMLTVSVFMCGIQRVSTMP